MDLKPHQYSGSVRLAASINVTCHGDRRCLVTQEPFGTFPSVLALNAVQAHCWETTVCAAFLYGACDQGSDYSYFQMAKDFDDTVVRWHQHSNWTWIMEQHDFGNGRVDWEDAFTILRGHLRNAPPQAVWLWLAREHYVVTALQDHVRYGPQVWERFFLGFPEPNDFPRLVNPYQAILEYYQGLLRIMNKTHGRRQMFHQIREVIQETERLFYRSGLID